MHTGRQRSTDTGQASQAAQYSATSTHDAPGGGHALVVVCCKGPVAHPRAAKVVDNQLWLLLALPPAGENSFQEEQGW
jgi:hypothetical protein